jgi:drug/metabolite transporter (DMT)-like permease
MLKWIVPLAILVLFEGVADVFSKSWSLKGGTVLATAALVSYAIANIFWLFALHNGSGLARGAILFSVSAAVIGLSLGLFVYHEKTTPLQTAGLMLGLVSLVFILWE